LVFVRQLLDSGSMSVSLDGGESSKTRLRGAIVESSGIMLSNKEVGICDHSAGTLASVLRVVC
jgi:hypothetical protein